MADTSEPASNAESTTEGLPSPAWICPGCGAEANAEYCAACGEHRPHPENLTLRHFFESVFESFFHADGRLWSTLRVLVAHPGELTLAFINGQRKKYLGPVQLFLLVNLFYFLIQSVTGWNTFSSPLILHVGDFAYHNLARTILDHRLSVLKLTYQQYEPLFNHAVALHAKSLVILMVPVFAIPVALLLWRRRRMVVPHLVFATHFMAFNLLVLCILQPLTSVVVTILAKGGIHPTWMTVDFYLSGADTIFQLVYLFLSARRVYPQNVVWTAVKACLLTLSLDYVVLAFRFVLFLITLYAG